MNPTRRLIDRYGFVAGLAVGVLLIMVIAPSKTPQQASAFGDGQFAPGENGEREALQPASGDPGLSTDTTAPGTDTTGGAAGSAASGGAAGGGSPTTGGPAGPAPRVGSDAPGADCSRQQVLNSTFIGCKPPWSGGDNGGATYRGVTGNSIKYVFYEANRPPNQEPVAGQDACSRENTVDSFRQMFEIFEQAINKHFQFYGRTIDIEYVPSPRPPSDAPGLRADAVEAVLDRGAFSVTAYEKPFLEETARRGVVAVGGSLATTAWLRSVAPFVWFPGADSDRTLGHFTEFMAKRVGNGPAVYAGGDQAGQPRKIGIVYHSDAASGLSALGPQLADLLRNAGFPVATFGIGVNQANWATESINVISAMKTQGVTSVTFVTQHIYPAWFTAVAAGQQFNPEYLVNGMGLQDAELLARFYAPTAPAQFGRAFGISDGVAPGACEDNIAVRAFRDIAGPDAKLPIGGTAQFLPVLFMAIGIESAGPRLDPATFRDGMFRLTPQRATGPNDISLGFGPGDYAAVKDFKEVWWDWSAIASDGQRGMYQSVGNGYRYQPGEWSAIPAQPFKAECLGNGACGSPPWP